MTEYKKHRDWLYFIIRDLAGNIQGVKFNHQACGSNFPHYVTFPGNKGATADFKDLTCSEFFEKYSNRNRAQYTRRKTKEFMKGKRETLRLAA